MKRNKEALKTARQLLQKSTRDGVLDTEKVRNLSRALLEVKPRHTLEILQAYHQLVRLELEKSRAIVETAAPLDEGLRRDLEAKLSQKLGPTASIEFRENPAHLAGLKVRVGSQVWDGTVATRLKNLRDQF